MQKHNDQSNTWMGGARLPYPTKPITLSWGVFEEYIIPEEDKEMVLDSLYCFIPKLRMNERKEDLHNGKKFKVKDFRVTREGNTNCLVSPFYEETGSTVIDWW